ncbi:LysM peptidoglycan-binding domain-containing protein [Tetragenococcus solitarius]|uniref:LysM peptidoglycan-binding domain-containing protein n=1 Tax=Tetragenococcus solitarius TaxID=71453 RepID=A0ABN3YEK8_9ENTE|nr:LysM peptidoglycan-binding domain-containing protein [Tetragenococcus solitarius]
MKLKKLLLGTALTAGTIFAVSTTTANADEIYTIQSNDSLSKISTKYVGDKSLVGPIVKANHIEDENMIYVGEQLTIPTDGKDTKAQQAPVQEQTASASAPKQQVEQQPAAEQQPAQETSSSNGGSTKAQFLAAGGTEEMWNTIVMPESGGNPNAVNPLGYRGLGQTKESWGTGSVEEQTKGMINYANSRYGSVANALSFRSANNWW